MLNHVEMCKKHLTDSFLIHNNLSYTFFRQFSFHFYTFQLETSHLISLIFFIIYFHFSLCPSFNWHMSCPIRDLKFVSVYVELLLNDMMIPKGEDESTWILVEDAIRNWLWSTTYTFLFIHCSLPQDKRKI